MHWAILRPCRRTTSLQPLLAAHLRSGGHFHGGASLLFIDDLDWGNQVYRQSRGWIRKPAAESSQRLAGSVPLSSAMIVPHAVPTMDDHFPALTAAALRAHPPARHSA